MDRLRVVKPMLNYVGINPQVFTAIDKDSYEFRDAPNKGELGCFESHRAISRDVIVNDYKWSLVLEDDINFNITFKEDLIKYMKLVLESEPTAEMVYFGTFAEGNARKEQFRTEPKVFRAYQ